MEKSKEAASWASKMAEGIPDEYRVAAFQEYLRFRLSGYGESETLQSHELPIGLNRAVNKRAEEKRANWISELVNDLPADHLVREMGSEEQKVAWAVVSLGNEGLAAINKTIRDYIKFNLGISPPTRQNTNRALRKLFPKHLSRENFDQGKSYVYLPKPSIKEVFVDLRQGK